MPPTPFANPPVLLVIASPLEARAILASTAPHVTDPASFQWRAAPIAPHVELIITGIGKSNAAAATALALQRTPYRAILSLGIAGALPDSNLSLGDAVLASSSIYADEGLLTPDGFQTCAAMGFPLGPFDGNAIAANPALLAAISPLAQHTGPIATVSTCSGADALAQAVRRRTGAIAECMEGAAIAHVCAVWEAQRATPCPFAEVRVISNTTGDRARQMWDMKRALTNLGTTTRAIIDRLAIAPLI